MGGSRLTGQGRVARSGGSELSAARLRIAVARLSRRLRPTEAAGSLTATEVDVLVAAERRGPIRLSDLASFAGLNPTMLSRLIPKLEQAALVRRLADEGDRRVCRLWGAGRIARLGSCEIDRNRPSYQSNSGLRQTWVLLSTAQGRHNVLGDRWGS